MTVAIEGATAATLAARKPTLVSRIQRVRSASGIEAWLVEDHSRALVTISFAFRRDVPAVLVEKVGSTGLMTALLLEGAGHLEGQAFQKATSDAAIDLNITTQRDHVSGRLKMLRSQTARGFELLGLALNAPQFADAAMERRRAMPMSVLSSQMSMLPSIARDAFVHRAFAAHPYGTTAAEAMAELRTVVRTDIDNAYATTITRAKAAIAVVGAISAQELADHLDGCFGTLPAGKSAEVANVELSGTGETILQQVPGPQTVIIFGRPALAYTDPDYASAQVITHILGGGFTSRLFQELREKRGLCYAVSTQLDTLPGMSTFIGSTSTPNEKSTEALDLIKTEIKRVLQEGLTMAEVEEAKSFMIGATRLGLNTSAAIADTLLTLQLHGKPPEWLDRRLEEIAAVSTAGIARTLPRLFGDRSMLVAMAGAPAGPA